MTLSQADLAEFRQRGVVVLRRFFSPADVHAIAAWLERLSNGQVSGAGEARYYEASPQTGEPILVRVEHFLGEGNPDITDRLLNPAVLAAARELLDDEPVLFKEKVNYKLPGCRADKLHQDQAAGWNAYGDYFLTMALAVDENRRDNAALTFLTSGRYPRALMGPEWEPLTQDDPPYEPAADYTLLEAAPGDVIFFDSYVPHGSPPNTSRAPRRNIYVTFNRRAGGDSRRRYYDDKWASYPPNTPAEVAGSRPSYRV